MTQIKYEAHDRWAYDTEHVDRALRALGVTLNRIIPQDHELIRRNITITAEDADACARILSAVVKLELDTL